MLEMKPDGVSDDIFNDLVNALDKAIMLIYDMSIRKVAFPGDMIRRWENLVKYARAKESEEGMERLTTRTDICCEPENDIVYYNPKDPDGLYNIIDLAKCAHEVDGEEANILLEISNRLAAYEDTGLTPAQVEAMKMDMEQLRADNINAEMNLAHMAADKDEQAGRLMKMDYLLRRTLPILAVTNDQQELKLHLHPSVLLEQINELLGGKEDES
jgi:hypothetical protein